MLENPMVDMTHPNFTYEPEQDVFGDYIYPGDAYYMIEGDCVHENNLHEYFESFKKEME